MRYAKVLVTTMLQGTNVMTQFSQVNMINSFIYLKMKEKSSLI